MSLAATTRNQYMTRARKLLKVLPLLKTDTDQHKLCREVIDRLLNKLGLDYDSPQLARGPGRPRSRLDADEILAGQNALQEAASEDQMREMQLLAEEERKKVYERDKWKKGTPAFEERERRQAEREQKALEKPPEDPTQAG